MERWREYFAFHGRATRLAYWRLQLVASGVGGLSIIAMMLVIPIVGRAGGILMAPIGAVLVASVAMAMRRLHDRGRSGWWLIPYWLAPLAFQAIPLPEVDGVTLAQLFFGLASWAIWLWAFVDLGFMRGTNGPNKFGPDPSAPTPEEVFA